MEKIASFTVDHLRLVPGVYVSRVDQAGGNPITTFDLRMTSPNDEPVMNCRSSHDRTSGRHILTQSCRICRQDHLFWTYGLPHRILSDSCRKLWIQRHRTIIKGNVPIYGWFRGWGSRSFRQRLWKLSGYESSDGKIFVWEVSYGGSWKYHWGAVTLSFLIAVTGIFQLWVICTTDCR